MADSRTEGRGFSFNSTNNSSTVGYGVPKQPQSQMYYKYIPNRQHNSSNAGSPQKHDPLQLSVSRYGDTSQAHMSSFTRSIPPISNVSLRPSSPKSGGLFIPPGRLGADTANMTCEPCSSGSKYNSFSANDELHAKHDCICAENCYPFNSVDIYHDPTTNVTYDMHGNRRVAVKKCGFRPEPYLIYEDSFSQQAPKIIVHEPYSPNTQQLATGDFTPRSNRASNDLVQVRTNNHEHLSPAPFSQSKDIFHSTAIGNLNQSLPIRNTRQAHKPEHLHTSLPYKQTNEWQNSLEDFNSSESRFKRSIDNRNVSSARRLSEISDYSKLLEGSRLSFDEDDEVWRLYTVKKMEEVERICTGFANIMQFIRNRHKSDIEDFPEIHELLKFLDSTQKRFLNTHLLEKPVCHILFQECPEYKYSFGIKKYDQLIMKIISKIVTDFMEEQIQNQTFHLEESLERNKERLLLSYLFFDDNREYILEMFVNDLASTLNIKVSPIKFSDNQDCNHILTVFNEYTTQRQNLIRIIVMDYAPLTANDIQSFIVKMAATENKFIEDIEGFLINLGIEHEIGALIIDELFKMQVDACEKLLQKHIEQHLRQPNNANLSQALQNEKENLNAMHIKELCQIWAALPNIIENVNEIRTIDGNQKFQLLENADECIKLVTNERIRIMLEDCEHDPIKLSTEVDNISKAHDEEVDDVNTRKLRLIIKKMIQSFQKQSQPGKSDQLQHNQNTQSKKRITIKEVKTRRDGSVITTEKEEIGTPNTPNHVTHIKVVKKNADGSIVTEQKDMVDAPPHTPERNLPDDSYNSILTSTPNKEPRNHTSFGTLDTTNMSAIGRPDSPTNNSTMINNTFSNVSGTFRKHNSGANNNKRSQNLNISPPVSQNVLSNRKDHSYLSKSLPVNRQNQNLLSSTNHPLSNFSASSNRPRGSLNGKHSLSLPIPRNNIQKTIHTKKVMHNPDGSITTKEKDVQFIKGGTKSDNTFINGNHTSRVHAENMIQDVDENVAYREESIRNESSPEMRRRSSTPSEEEESFRIRRIPHVNTTEEEQSRFHNTLGSMTYPNHETFHDLSNNHNIMHSQNIGGGLRNRNNSLPNDSIATHSTNFGGGLTYNSLPNAINLMHSQNLGNGTVVTLPHDGEISYSQNTDGGNFMSTPTTMPSRHTEAMHRTLPHDGEISFIQNTRGENFMSTPTTTSSRHTEATSRTLPYGGEIPHSQNIGGGLQERHNSLLNDYNTMHSTDVGGWWAYNTLPNASNLMDSRNLGNNIEATTRTTPSRRTEATSRSFPHDGEILHSQNIGSSNVMSTPNTTSIRHTEESFRTLPYDTTNSHSQNIGGPNFTSTPRTTSSRHTEETFGTLTNDSAISHSQNISGGNFMSMPTTTPTRHTEAASRISQHDGEIAHAQDIGGGNSILSPRPTPSRHFHTVTRRENADGTIITEEEDVVENVPQENIHHNQHQVDGQIIVQTRTTNPDGTITKKEKKVNPSNKLPSHTKLDGHLNVTGTLTIKGIASSEKQTLSPDCSSVSIVVSEQLAISNKPCDCVFSKILSSIGDLHKLEADEKRDLHKKLKKLQSARREVMSSIGIKYK